MDELGLKKGIKIWCFLFEVDKDIKNIMNFFNLIY